MSNPNIPPQPQQPVAPPQYAQGAPYNNNTPNIPPSGAVAGTVPLDQPYYGCSFTEAFLRFWKKYATFKGRASRSEFWWFALANVIIVMALGVIADYVDQLSFLPGLWALATVVPTIALGVRRLHDTNRSGWWLFGYYAAIIVTVIAGILIAAGTIGSLFSNRACSIAMYTSGAFDGIMPRSMSGCTSSETIASLGITLLVCVAIVIALEIAYIVFMASASKPEGARFDENPRFPQPAAPAYTAPTYGAPTYGNQPYNAPTYGAPTYGQQQNQAPAYGAPVYSTPAAPAAPTAPAAPAAGQQFQPYQAPVAPATPTAPVAQPVQPVAETPAYQAPTVPAMPAVPTVPTVPETEQTPEAEHNPFDASDQPAQTADTDPEQINGQNGEAQQ
ncbi:DUF805 domain-containing protein [Bifidobacterium sp. 64T4]|uniref:DUF805 domain-containing protein n=1 Tax=Bifidobacterium pongonis TaxID=2834432 RepID=UPI001C5A087F|nr:DUF805 domain-containing protein [Bifidobacterium pongonis]MBW3094716.1 DUF805 domain-containing protein [Bifidobacterium pongonis]